MPNLKIRPYVSKAKPNFAKSQVANFTLTIAEIDLCIITNIQTLP